MKEKDKHAWYYNSMVDLLKELGDYPEYQEYVRLAGRYSAARLADRRPAYRRAGFGTGIKFIWTESEITLIFRFCLLRGRNRG